MATVSLPKPQAAPGTIAPAAPLYFVHPAVDLLLIGGASLLVFPLYFLLHWSPVWAAGAAALLQWVCNYPHFAATSYRLYHSKSNRAQYPLTAWGAPVLVAAAVGGALLSPEMIAPAFIKLYLLWSPYHFSAQSVGITMIYARRAGIRLDGFFRGALTCYVFGSFIAQSALAEAGMMDIRYFGVRYPQMGLPQWVGQSALLFLALSTLVFAALVFHWSIKSRRLFPLIVLVPGVAQIVWFVAGGGVAAYSVFVPFFHSLQYLLIAWFFQMKERRDIAQAEGETKSGRAFVSGESLRWGAVILVTGAILFEALPRAVSHFGHLGLPFVTGVVLAGVQIHHFFVDGVVWKLRDKRVSSPLLVDLDDLINEEKPAPAKGREEGEERRKAA